MTTGPGGEITEPIGQLALIRGQLDLVLWRLNVIEEQRDDDTRWRRQVWTAIVVALLTGVLGVLLPVLTGLDR